MESATPLAWCRQRRWDSAQLGLSLTRDVLVVVPAQSGGAVQVRGRHGFACQFSLAIRRPEILLEVKVAAEGWEYCHRISGIFP